jgi:exoribonuclease-2
MADLQEIARRALSERDFQPDFPAKAREEVRRIVQGFPQNLEKDDGSYVQDLRELLWFSIDNVDTHDLDQLSVAEGERDGDIRLRVAIADVSALVTPDSAIDQRAYHNTTSIYTPAGTFPMLPPELSEGLTSLHEGEDRLAVVVDMTVDDDGSIKETEIYRARAAGSASSSGSMIRPRSACGSTGTSGARSASIRLRPGRSTRTGCSPISPRRRRTAPRS